MADSPAEISPLHVVDTNALIWYLTGHPRLSRTVESIFEAASRGETRLILSAIVVSVVIWQDLRNAGPDPVGDQPG